MYLESVKCPKAKTRVLKSDGRTPKSHFFELAGTAVFDVDLEDRGCAKLSFNWKALGRRWSKEDNWDMEIALDAENPDIRIDGEVPEETGVVLQQTCDKYTWEKDLRNFLLEEKL